ncbi:MAG: glycosyltransferase, partial [Anaerolineae bacterium]|nr:glycosyltransferase [Anaerolineae bacterium]
MPRRLLFLAPQVPYPPHQGTTIRNYNLMANLAEDYEVHLLCFQQEGDDPVGNTPLPRLLTVVDSTPAPKRSTTRRAITTVTSRLPDMALRLASDTYQTRLGALLEQYRYDIVQIEGIEMAPYGLWLANHPLWRSARVKENLPGIPIGRPALVFDDHNAEYVLQQRAWETDVRRPARWHAAAYSAIQVNKLRRYERQICQQADRVVAVSEADRDSLRALDSSLNITVVPNGVDLDYYAAYSRERDSQAPDYGPQALVFTGKMDFRPNIDAVVWFANEVLPLIQRAEPETRFVIVGKEPHPRVQELASRPGVTVTGWVPDIRAHIAAAAVYVVPLRIGGGTRLKVLEAMAMRSAIVSTRLGCEGFPLGGQEIITFADDAPAFADATVALLRDPARRARQGEAGRLFVEANYGWSAIVPRLRAVYDTLSS